MESLETGDHIGEPVHTSGRTNLYTSIATRISYLGIITATRSSFIMEEDETLKKQFDENIVKRLNKMCHSLQTPQHYEDDSDKNSREILLQEVLTAYLTYSNCGEKKKDFMMIKNSDCAEEKDEVTNMGFDA